MASGVLPVELHGSTRPDIPSTTRSLVDTLVEEEPALVQAVVERIEAELDPGRRGDPTTRRQLRNLVGRAVAELIHRLAAGGRGQTSLEPVLAHARAHRIGGGSLKRLLSLYRLGGLAVLEYAHNVPGADTLDAGTLLRFTEDVFEFVDELSVAAADAFVAVGATLSSPGDARRARLHSLLLNDPPVLLETLRDAAQLAGWPLPSRLRVAVSTAPNGLAAGSTPSRVLCGVLNGQCVLIVEDDEESEPWLARAAGCLGVERPLVISPAAGVERVRQAAVHAIALRRMLRSDAPTRTPAVVRCDEHEVDLLLALDRELSQSFSDRLLAPILELAIPQRDRMLDTLEAWLANPGRPLAMAAALHLHVQGVRYRLARLRALLGDALDDPQSRFELALALRARRLHAREPDSQG